MLSWTESYNSSITFALFETCPFCHSSISKWWNFSRNQIILSKIGKDWLFNLKDYTPQSLKWMYSTLHKHRFHNGSLSTNLSARGARWSDFGDFDINYISISLNNPLLSIWYHWPRNLWIPSICGTMFVENRLHSQK